MQKTKNTKSYKKKTPTQATHLLEHGRNVIGLSRIGFGCAYDALSPASWTNCIWQFLHVELRPVLVIRKLFARLEHENQ